ncbi:TlpA disulfide reductase family protein [uncultured Sphingomonas sp.]|uniref:TlpA family protein disulfide reductase n=1 Tax=uncultured Sphingomonas sp. TaxID=158754 RepID=UPI0025896C29|nr:TlpA disulfide reductase family protein [uncultured Sphingomonas sp.]
MASRVAIVCLLGVAVATAACDRASPGNGQAQADTAATNASPDEAAPAGTGAATGAKADKVDRSHKGEAAPDVAFAAPGGKEGPTTLAAFRGKPVLVNLWATWCAPCVKEMPTLDAAAATLGDRVPVLAISQDMDPAKAVAFLDQRRFTHLRPYLDAKLGLSLAYGTNLPTTILYGADGKEIWRVTGDLDWTGAQAKALLAEAA